MKQTKKKAVKLNKETLRAIGTPELHHIAGGALPQRGSISLPVCTSPGGGC